METRGENASGKIAFFQEWNQYLQSETIKKNFRIGVDDQFEDILLTDNKTPFFSHIIQDGKKEIIAEIIKQIQKISLEKKILFQVDNEGNNLFHYIVKRNDLSIAEIILPAFSNEVSFIANLNRANAEGNTPINLLANTNLEMASLFLRYGADLSVGNNNGEFPFAKSPADVLIKVADMGGFIGQHLPDELITKLNDVKEILLVNTSSFSKLTVNNLPLEKVKQLYLSSNEETQAIILQSCQYALRRSAKLSDVETRKSSKLPDVANFYYQCIGMQQKLRDLAIAHLNSDSTIPLASFYKQIKRSKEQEKEKISRKMVQYSVSYAEEKIPYHILKMIPAYWKKLDNGAKKAKSNVDIHHLNKDRQVLFSFNKKLDQIEETLKKNYQLYHFMLGLTVALPLTMLLVAFSIALWLLMNIASMNSDDENTIMYVPLKMLPFIIFSGVFFLMFLYNKQSSWELELSPSHWKNLIDSLTEALTQAKKSPFGERSEGQQLIKALKKNIHELNHKHTKTELKIIFEKIRINLNKIQVSMNLSQTPIGFFPKGTASSKSKSCNNIKQNERQKFLKKIS